MSKLTKFFAKPHLYLSDAVRNAIEAQTVRRGSARQFSIGKPTAILVGFSDWKTFMVDFLPDHNVFFLGHSPNISRAAIRSIIQYPNPSVYAWSYKFPPYLAEYCRRNSIPLTFVEDGFIRSFGLGADRSQPLSLVFDQNAMHFDRSKPSDLEHLLKTHDFAADRELMALANGLATEIRTTGLSKYNFALPSRRIIDLLGRSPSRKKVLVLGQVEDDLSMTYGAPKSLSGNDLVIRAVLENEDAIILYRPHPESLAYSKPHYSNPSAVAPLCHVLGPEYSLLDCLSAADTVYTVTSLAGFEAALHGKKVVTFGAPFYAGWGFTEDRIPIERRGRQLLPEEVLAAAYILYPRYYHPISGQQIQWQEAIGLMRRFRTAVNAVDSDRQHRCGNRYEHRKAAAFGGE